MGLCRKFTALNGTKNLFQCEVKGRFRFIDTMAFNSIFMYIFWRSWNSIIRVHLIFSFTFVEYFLKLKCLIWRWAKKEVLNARAFKRYILKTFKCILIQQRVYKILIQSTILTFNVFGSLSVIHFYLVKDFIRLRQRFRVLFFLSGDGVGDIFVVLCVIRSFAGWYILVRSKPFALS